MMVQKNSPKDLELHTDFKHQDQRLKHCALLFNLKALSLPRFKRRLQRYQQRYEKISNTTLLLL